MEGQNVASRYTKALFDVARKGSLDTVRSELEGLDALLKDTPEFAAFVANPSVPQDKQAAVLESMFKGKLSDLVLNFLLLLVRKHRLHLLPLVPALFATLSNEEQGILPVEVVSAGPLSTEQLNALSEKLGQRTGKTIRPTVTVDESLLGGFRIRIGDRIEDLSIATKLNNFKRNVINA